jgi:hypothetical protein
MLYYARFCRTGEERPKAYYLIFIYGFSYISKKWSLSRIREYYVGAYYYFLAILCHTSIWRATAKHAYYANN